jgi:predicted DCC family thiol-disulfide oxidoreductase YuxK
MTGSVIYDGDCAFCSSAARFAKSKIAPNLNYMAYQQTELSNYGLTTAQCETALQFVNSAGKIFTASQAIAQLLLAARFPYSQLGKVLQLPLIRNLAQLGYLMIAKNRHRLPCGTPTCKLDD